MTSTLTVGDLTFDLRWSERRQTVGVTVDRDGSLVLHAPTECPIERVEEVAREKREWVYRKLAEKDLLFARPRAKEYVSGETFYYLGRSYRLKLFHADGKAETPPLRLYRGRFLLRQDGVAEAEQHFRRWYRDHGRPWIAERVERFAPRLRVQPSSIEVRDLGYRWGSCNAVGGVNFHWRTVLLPPRIIEYVVVHELAHLLFPHHGAEFWTRVERVLPDYGVRKQWLASEGARYY